MTTKIAALRAQRRELRATMKATKDKLEIVNRLIMNRMMEEDDGNEDMEGPAPQSVSGRPSESTGGEAESDK